LLVPDSCIPGGQEACGARRDRPSASVPIS
jgi:hypothetical protein